MRECSTRSPLAFLFATLLLVGCGTVAAPPTAVALPTPIVIYVTPAPMPTPTMAPTGLHTMTVEITLFDPTVTGTIVSYGDTECAGWHAFSIFDAGLKATIKDAAGIILGVAAFDQHGKSITKSGPSTTECRLTSTSVDVPKSPLYAVDFGRPTGCLEFQFADLEASGWVAELTIGDKKSPRPRPTPVSSHSPLENCHPI